MAFHAPEKGLNLFSGHETPKQVLVLAYSLETGLHGFYSDMAGQVKSDDARQLFSRLAKIEIVHQDRIFKEYIKMNPRPMTREAFTQSVTTAALEGGLTTEEYAANFKINWEAVEDIIGLAMSIEAQAMDLYERAADASGDSDGRSVLRWIADEERSHLALLGRLMERV